MTTEKKEEADNYPNRRFEKIYREKWVIPENATWWQRLIGKKVQERIYMGRIEIIE